MEKEFVNYIEALSLKELGFNEPCFAYYNIDPYLKSPAFNLVKPFDHEWCLPAPLYQQAFRWFREKYDLQYNIIWNKFYEKTPYQYEVRQTWRNETLRPYGTSGMCKTYEEAELACLKKLIEIVKNKI
jgi:hypothetical protein